MLTLTSLKSYVEGHLAEMSQAIGSEYHSAIANFCKHVEGKEALKDAVALIRGTPGYTVRTPEDAVLTPAHTLAIIRPV